MPLPIITGATATGKSALAQALARLTGAHIVSVDSMKVYRGMDVGTDKPPAAILNEIPHHMLDLVGPRERFSVARYLELAAPLIERLRAEGTRLLLEGGTALYIKALTEGMFEGVGRDEEFRRTLRREAAERGAAHLHERLARVDAAAAARIHPNDLKRIVRALEVHHLTGLPISRLQEQFGDVKRPRRIIALWRPRDELRRRVAERAARMFKEGILEETRRILDGGGFGPTASQCPGYAEAAAHLRGETTIEEAARRTATRHWRLARRQNVWLKRFDDALHLCLRGSTDWPALAARLASRLFEE